MRTCKEDQELYKVESTHKNVELVLYNFVMDNEMITGYFQGLNFVAHFIFCVMRDTKDATSLLNYISDHVFTVVSCSNQVLLQLYEVQIWRRNDDTDLHL